MSRTTKIATGSRQFDVIVVGGGIYGIMVALEAALRSRHVLLLERDKWGSGTTENWLRILHGGLRYLQTMDLPRFFESVRERGWYIEHFAEYVRPLECIMPLYNGGPRSKFVMRAALLANDTLSLRRNDRLPESHQLPSGKIIPADDVRERLSFIQSPRLSGGAVWHDALVTEPELLLKKLIGWCRSCGVVLNDFANVTKVLSDGGLVRGVDVEFADIRGRQTFRSGCVVNATGPDVTAFALRAGSEITRPPGVSWAWNVLYDVPYQSTSAAALQALRRDAQTYFVVPWQGRALVGTGHAPAPAGSSPVDLPPDYVEEFTENVAQAAPELGIEKSKIVHVFSGFLPVDASDPSKLTSRPLLVDHARDGLKGLHSVWGVKYTTARAVAIRLCDQLFGRHGNRNTDYWHLNRLNTGSRSSDITLN